HAADDQSTRRVERLDPRRLDPPQRVAEVVRKRENVVEQVGAVGGSNLGRRLGLQRTTSPGARRAPSPISAPGSISAPSPITAPPPSRAPSPTVTPGARIAS